MASGDRMVEHYLLVYDFICFVRRKEGEAIVAEVLVMDIICDVFQVLHVRPERTNGKHYSFVTS